MLLQRKRSSAQNRCCVDINHTKKMLPPIDFGEWLSKNAVTHLRPPVNNYCLYSGEDFVVMVVGGPNERYLRTECFSDVSTPS